MCPVNQGQIPLGLDDNEYQGIVICLRVPILSVNTIQGEGLGNIHLMSKGGMKPASWGLWAVQACPSFLRNNVENKQTNNSIVIFGEKKIKVR